MTGQQRNSKRKNRKTAWIIAGIIALTLIVLSLWQVPYTVTESYQDKEPYQAYEYYTETVNSNNCDSTAGM